MKEKLVGNTVRDQKKRKRLISTVAMLIIFAVLVAILLVTGAVEKMTDTNSISDSLSQFIGIDKKDSGFPVSFSTNDIIDVEAKSKKLCVLTEKFITLVREDGEIDSTKQITYAQPALYANENFAVVFDRLSDKYTLIDKKGNFEQKQDKNGNKILNARVTDKGETLLSLRSDSCASVLHAIDKKGDDLLIWSCTEEYIVTFDMSGDMIYCAALGAFGGEIFTKIYVLKMGEDEPVCEYTLPSTACIELNHISSGKFSLLCDDGIYIFDIKKDDVLTERIIFSSEMIGYDTDTQGNIVVVCNDNDDFSKNLLSIYNSGGKMHYSLSVEDDITDISISGKETFLLYEDGIKTVTSSGKEGQELSYAGRCTGVLTAGNKIYCYSLGGVEKALSK